MSDIKADRSEVLHYDNPDFQVQFKKNFIPANVVFYDLAMHWHDDIEFIYIISGSAFYQMGDKKVKMNAGEGIFVNSRQMHLLLSDSCDCTLYCLMFHPMILCSSHFISETFVTPVIENDRVPYIMLRNNVSWHQKILQDIADMEKYTEQPGGQLEVMKYIYDIWNLIYQNTSLPSKEERIRNRDLAAVKKMTNYIQTHYQHKITLQDICAAGNVGKTKCNALFATYINLTPMEYVKNYRIEKSSELLNNTDLTITEIAYEVGFGEASYFSKIFGQQIGCTPQQYRNLGKEMSEYYEKPCDSNLWTHIQNTDN